MQATRKEVLMYLCRARIRLERPFPITSPLILRQPNAFNPPWTPLPINNFTLLRVKRVRVLIVNARRIISN